MINQGFFITLEGGEGTGKTTQIGKLASLLEDHGRTVITTREPGGTPEAEKIRSLLVQRDGGDWTPEAECLLLFAARNIHVEKLIKPAMQKDGIVISDRFTDSTRAYQSYGHGLDMGFVESLARLAIGGFEPDLTFILDLEVEKGLNRAGKRLADSGSGEDRFEQMGKAFHERLRQGYLEIAERNPQRCVVIDASRPVEAIAREIGQIALARLGMDVSGREALNVR